MEWFYTCAGIYKAQVRHALVIEYAGDVRPRPILNRGRDWNSWNSWFPSCFTTVWPELSLNWHWNSWNSWFHNFLFLFFHFNFFILIQINCFNCFTVSLGRNQSKLCETVDFANCFNCFSPDPYLEWTRSRWVRRWLHVVKAMHGPLKKWCKRACAVGMSGESNAAKWVGKV